MKIKQYNPDGSADIIFDENEIKKLGENPMGIIQSLMGGLPGFGGGGNDGEDDGSDDEDGSDEEGENDDNQKSKRGKKQYEIINIQLLIYSLSYSQKFTNLMITHTYPTKFAFGYCLTGI